MHDYKLTHSRRRTGRIDPCHKHLAVAVVAVVFDVAPGYRGWGQKWRLIFTYVSRNRRRRRLIKTLDVLELALEQPAADLGNTDAIRKTVQGLIAVTRDAGRAELDAIDTFFKENPPPRRDWQRLLRRS